MDVKCARTASRLEKYLSTRFIGAMDITRQFNLQNLKYLVGAKRREAWDLVPFFLFLSLSRRLFPHLVQLSLVLRARELFTEA